MEERDEAITWLYVSAYPLLMEAYAIFLLQKKLQGREKKMSVQTDPACQKRAAIWIRDCFPDLDLFAELLRKAKGKRSAEKFAIECGISAASMRRTLQKIRKHPMCYEDIRSVAEHAAPESHVTMHMLLLSSGTRLPDGMSIQEAESM